MDSSYGNIPLIPGRGKTEIEITAIGGNQMLKNQSVKSLLMGLLAGIVVLLIVIAVAVWNETNAISSAAEEMGKGKDVVADILPPPLYILEAELTVLQLQKARGEDIGTLASKLDALKKDYDDRNSYWTKMRLDASIEQSLFGKQKQSAEEFWKLVQGDFIAAIKAGDTERAKTVAGQLEKAYDVHRAGVDETVKVASTYAEDSLNSLHTTSANVRWVMLVLVIGGAVLTSMFMILVIREILRRLGGEPLEMQEAARHIAGGDLTLELTVKHGDENSLKGSIIQMQHNLRHTISNSREAAERVAAAARSLAESSQKVMQDSNQQCDATTSMAASVEEMNVSISHVADSAVSARDLANETGKLSTEGKGLVQNTIGEINRISESVTTANQNILSLDEESKEISNIIKVINGIAEQTNLLALNAAIEAARAGEQGRGFAVVADEVRKLAERTSLSTKEITTMISAMQSATQGAVDGMEAGRNQVDAGVKMAAKTGESMARIHGESQRVLEAVDEISSALREQSGATDQIARSVEMIAQMSEANGAALSVMFQSANQLEKYADELRASVNQFKV
jgi:methyl-accepting chemotaxis protein